MKSKANKYENDKLVDVIDAIGSSDFLPNLLDLMRQDVPFVGVLLLLLDEEDKPHYLFDTIRDSYRIYMDMYLDGVFQLDPFYTKYRKEKSAGAWLIRDIAPDRFQQTEYFKRYYKNIEIQDEAALFIDLGNGKFLFFSIGRRAHETKFRRNDLKLLNANLKLLTSLCRQHFSKGDYGGPNLFQAAQENEGRLRFALERFGDGKLTKREQEVAVCILKGHSSKSMAREIDISPETIKIHRRNLYRKLEISSQSELFVKFLNTLG
ncbi:MAG: helix-turn-helix transcriptional regulator [Alphaproteobacteria bacterium]|nr:helix-turn-helix transcriptional regulator [Alphaproteobacteria bacterium]